MAFQGSDGGYSGGPGQLAHLATSYAAVNTLVTLGGDKALSSVNRVHDMGEMDVRACYLAISIASILNILDDELTRGLGDYILSCQTYEGGIGGEPGSEAHAGNTYCGLATITMALITEVDRLNLDSLMNWIVHQQGVEKGFQGRTNMLVDGCYTFWQTDDIIAAAVNKEDHLPEGTRIHNSPFTVNQQLLHKVDAFLLTREGEKRRRSRDTYRACDRHEFVCQIGNVKEEATTSE
ncbi:hypothetical protein DY000_02033359 [Brassica cretica]|uniref:Prenyltransferase alpha-alpha toroid domain-containing protein n=1 Tax=Brassica cretica TaxID=69181 RepID=A0ABQ7DUV2_BRACR|nr:hypothetical protein DY000_02033359 [Brassica cretica]